MQGKFMNNQEFIELIKENKFKLYKTAMAILQNDDDANDAIQEALLSAYKNKDKLRKKEYFTTWLITILRNKCFDIIKNNKKVANIDETIIENTEGYYDTYKEESSLERFLNQLENELREITVYYYYDELDVKEIAKIMDIPTGTVKSRLSRARQKIKAMIEKEEGEY